MEVAREMEIDLVHGDDLGVATARGAPFHAEDRPEARLADADHHFLAEPAQGLTYPDGDRALALARGGRVDPGDEDEPARGLPLGDGLGGDLGLVAAVGKNLIGAEADLSRHLGDRAQLGGLRDGDVGGDGGHWARLPMLSE